MSKSPGPARRAEPVEISQFKNACPPPRGTGSGPPYKFFLRKLSTQIYAGYLRRGIS